MLEQSLSETVQVEQWAGIEQRGAKTGLKVNRQLEVFCKILSTITITFLKPISICHICLQVILCLPNVAVLLT